MAQENAEEVILKRSEPLGRSDQMEEYGPHTSYTLTTNQGIVS